MLFIAYSARCLTPAFAMACAIGLVLAGHLMAQADRRPNILYIMSDDHAAHAISAYQSRLAEVAPTPNIDRLAREGALFTNAFCTNSICSPSRACVLTGQYDHVNGAFDLAGEVLPGKQMLAIEMGKAGYQTAMVGKWHLKAEPADFDYYCVLPGQGSYHDPEFLIRGDKPWGENRIKFEKQHSTDVITDLTLDWLRHGRDASKPFFLMHHYKAPHDYFDNAERYESYLADVDIPEPESLWHRDARFGSLATRGADNELLPHIGTSIGGRNPRRSYLLDLPALYPKEFPANYDPGDHSDEENTRLAYNAYLKKFLRCVKGIDDNLGRLFQYLDESGQLDQTLIIYTADQGFMLGEHDYQDKRWMYEESQRMPFIVRYPQSVAAGQRFDTIIENVDYAPTMLEFADAEIPATVQGRSFKSLLETGREPADWKQEAYYRYWMHMAHHDNPAHVGIRTKTHKLIYYYGCNYDGGYRTPPAWELYDLVHDPHETRNIYADDEQADTVAELKQRLADTRRRVGDDGSHYPACEKIIQEFWDYDLADQRRAREISRQFLERRLEELESGKRNVPTHRGKSQTDVSIHLWYGDHLRFGHLGGHPQRWVNVLGHISQAEQVSALTYQLNDQAAKPLSFQEDHKRIARNGDFNVELARTDLKPGENRVVIEATAWDGSTIRQAVTIDYTTSGQGWPLPYAVDWSQVQRLEDAVQVVDGRWQLTTQGVRSVEPYYDRVLAFGDATWRDYEVQTSIQVHGLTAPKSGSNATGVTHAAIALRWPGHSADGNQPSVQWHPLGATAEFRLGGDLSACRWRIFDGQRQMRVEASRRRVLDFETKYAMKHRVETLADGSSRYRTKLWKADAPEPEGWDLERMELQDDVPNGSALLLAHHSDVTFGNIRVVPLNKR